MLYFSKLGRSDWWCFSIQIYDEMYVYELLPIYSTKLDDCSKDEESYKISKIPNLTLVVQSLG